MVFSEKIENVQLSFPNAVLTTVFTYMPFRVLCFVSFSKLFNFNAFFGYTVNCF